MTQGEVYNGMPLQHHQMTLQQQQAQQQLNAYGHNNRSPFRDQQHPQLASFSSQGQLPPAMVVPPFLSSPSFGTLDTPQGFVDTLDEDGAGGMYGEGLVAPLPLTEGGQQQQQQLTDTAPSLTPTGGTEGSAEQIDPNGPLTQAFEQLSTSSSAVE